MANRYQTIRSQLTDLWEGAKRDAREERKKLTTKYEGKLTDMSRKVSDLETNLLQAQKSSEELATVLTDLQVQKDRAKQETQQVEARYITMISQRNREIAASVAGFRRVTREAENRVLELFGIDLDPPGIVRTLDMGGNLRP